MLNADQWLIKSDKFNNSKMYQPDFSSISGLISHLNNDELKEIINDDTKFEDLLKDLEQVITLKLYLKLYCVN